MTDRDPNALPKADDDTDQFPIPVSGSDDADAAAADDAKVSYDAGAADEDEGFEDAADGETGETADERAAAAVAAPAAPSVRLGPRLGRGMASGAPALTPSERAVRIEDRTSAIFVIGVVVTFLGVLLYGMLGGAGGFFTHRLVTSPSASLGSPSASASSPSASASTESPATSASAAAPTAKATPTPKPPATARPSPTPPPSATPGSAPTPLPSGS